MRFGVPVAKIPVIGSKYKFKIDSERPTINSKLGKTSSSLEYYN